MTYQTHLPPGVSLIEMQSTASTNDEAKKRAAAGAASGTVIFAHMQTAGRGRQGNSWTSIEGNLFMSVILRPEQLQERGQLSFLSAVALAETLESRGLKPELKWPNDLLLDGKKAAGILLETESIGGKPADWVVIGIGANIVAAPEGAVSLKSLGIDGVTAVALLEKLVERLMSWYAIWQKDGFEPVRQAWLFRAGHLGRKMNVRLPKETFAGIFKGIDTAGALQIEMQDGSQRLVSSGEVFI